MEVGVYNPARAYEKDLEAYFYGRGEDYWCWQTGLFQQIKDLNSSQALWRPTNDRHCIWDVVRHINFWKRYVIAAITKQPKPDPDVDSWSKLPAERNEDKWQEELERTKKLHEDFINLSKEKSEILFEVEEGPGAYMRQLIYHDAYHSGQIGLLWVMQGLKPIE